MGTVSLGVQTPEQEIGAANSAAGFRRV